MPWEDLAAEVAAEFGALSVLERYAIELVDRRIRNRRITTRGRGGFHAIQNHHKRACKTCGKRYLPTAHHQKYCTPACRVLVKTNAICALCGAEIPGRVRKYCPTPCARKAQQIRDTIAQRARRAQRRLTSISPQT